MLPGRRQKFIPVLDKKSRFTHSAKVSDEVSGRNILYCRATSIKYFTHPDLIICSKHLCNFCYKIFTKKTGWSISMGLEPGYNFRRYFLAGFNGHGTFHWIVCIIINHENTMLFAQDLMPTVD